jgi:hypothetical protein
MIRTSTGYVLVSALVEDRPGSLHQSREAKVEWEGNRKGQGMLVPFIERRQEQQPQFVRE